MILTLAHTKGGVGKSMLATQLALGWAIAGRDVLLVDADRQATSQLVVAKREEKARSPTVTCVSYVEGGLLRERGRGQAPKYDTPVIDVGGRDGPALRAALLLSDLVLVPVPARSVDVWH